jgi:uncharacterized protein
MRPTRRHMRRVVGTRRSGEHAARWFARPKPGRRLPSLPFLQPPPRHALSDAQLQLLLGGPRGALSFIQGSRYALLLTFRRDGTPVPTPVNAAVASGHIYVRSEREAGKVKRLRNDPSALLAPCTVRGEPLGPPLAAHGRVLDASDERPAELALAARSGLGRAVFELVADLFRVDMCYLEFIPTDRPADGLVR